MLCGVRTFIVRVQQGTADAGAATGTVLRGVVDDVSTGARATFRSPEELLTALASMREAAPITDPHQKGD